MAANAGGIVSWLIGLKAGRRVLTAPGPLHGLRLRSVARGEAVFRRAEVVAIILTPGWVAGINDSRARLYLPTNAISALALWAAPIAIGAYFAGPPLLDLVSDFGLIASVGLVLFVAVIAAGEIRRRRRTRRGARAPTAP